MGVALRRLYSPQEYVALEHDAEYKSEFVAGEIIARAGGSPRHGQIAQSAGNALGNEVRTGPCRVYNSDVRVWTGDEHGCYPDVSVVCDSPREVPQDRDAIANPIVIVEVLSKSTEAYDRGLKFRRYRQLESLQEYVLISQDEPHIEVHSRQPDGSWLMREAAGIEGSIDLRSVGCTLQLADIYDKVVFPANPTTVEPA